MTFSKRFWEGRTQPTEEQKNHTKIILAKNSMIIENINKHMFLSFWSDAPEKGRLVQSGSLDWAVEDLESYDHTYMAVRGIDPNEVDIDLAETNISDGYYHPSMSTSQGNEADIGNAVFWWHRWYMIAPEMVGLVISEPGKPDGVKLLPFGLSELVNDVPAGGKTITATSHTGMFARDKWQARTGTVKYL